MDRRTNEAKADYLKTELFRDGSTLENQQHNPSCVILQTLQTLCLNSSAQQFTANLLSVVVGLHGCFALSSVCFAEGKCYTAFVYIPQPRACVRLASVTRLPQSLQFSFLYIESATRQSSFGASVFTVGPCDWITLNTHTSNQFPAHNKLSHQQPVMISTKDVREKQNMYILPLRSRA